jgi:hypothetical protein
MKRNLEKRREWEGRIAAWLASGLTRRAFCERERLKRPTFDYWHRRIRSEAAQAAVPRMTLVPVALEQLAEDRRWVLKSPRGWELSLPASTETDRLAMLLERLG